MPLYPQFQQFFRYWKPPTNIVWGEERQDLSRRGGIPMRDLQEAEFHLLDSGHFALDGRLAEMAPLIRDFLDRKVASR